MRVMGKLAQLRESARLSQETVGGALGVSQAAVSRRETDGPLARDISLCDAERYAELLDHRLAVVPFREPGLGETLGALEKVLAGLPERDYWRVHVLVLGILAERAGGHAGRDGRD